jgi:hypothetical protein
VRFALALALGIITGLLAISFLLITLLSLSLSVMPNGSPPGMPINLNFIVWMASVFFGGLAGFRVFEFVRGARRRPTAERNER